MQTKSSFEIRTTLGRPAMAFDTLERAKEFKRKTPHAKEWRIYEIMRVEREITL